MEAVTIKHDRSYFENMDALRFISFMVVFLFHTRLYEFIASITDNVFLLSILRITCCGNWGVTFFFTISGFLITWLLFAEQSNYQNIALGKFYLRRIFRIWPLYFLVFLSGSLLLPQLYKLAHKPFYYDYSNLLFGGFLSNFGVLALDPAANSIRSYSLIMVITWSVSIEEQFYLFWPVLFKHIRRNSYIIPVFFILLSFITAIIYRHNWEVCYYSTFTRLGELAIGGLVAYLSYYNTIFKKHIETLSKQMIVVVYLLLFLLVYFSFQFYLFPLVYFAFQMAGAFLFSIIILEQNFSTNSLFKLGRLKVASRLGKISYGLYMLHPLAMFFCSVILQMVLHRANPVNDGPAYIIGTFLLTLVFSAISWRFLELPFLKIKKKFEHGI